MEHFLLARNFFPLNPHLGDGKSHALAGWCICSQASGIWWNDGYASSKLPDTLHTPYLHFILSYFQKPQEPGDTSKLLWARRALPTAAPVAQQLQSSSTQVLFFYLLFHLPHFHAFRARGKIQRNKNRGRIGVKTKQTVQLLLLSAGSHSTGIQWMFSQPTLNIFFSFSSFFLFSSIWGADYATFYLHKHHYLCLLTYTECSVCGGITSVLLDPSDLAS